MAADDKTEAALEAAREAPRLELARVRELIGDPDEVAKGTAIADQGGLEHAGRHGARLYADARGSGAEPYKVQVAFDDGGVPRARCTCMAARSRPYCKHAAALLVLWARAPEAFAVAVEGPPELPFAPRGKKQVKTGRTDVEALRKGGAGQVARLVRELAAAGAASLGAGRADEVRALGDGLRESQLHRLGARTIALGDLLAEGADKGGLDADRYADLLGDLLLTARRIEQHLAGKALELRQQDELIGRTWTKRDRRPTGGLDLVQYAYLAGTLPDGFYVREARFLDLASGAHVCEKQILPGPVARRTPPLPNRGGRRLVGVAATAFPGFPPERLALEGEGEARPLDRAAFDALAARCLPSARAALDALVAHRRDFFAPDRLPIAARLSTLVVSRERRLAADASGAAIPLHLTEAAEDTLAEALAGARLVAFLGDLGLAGAAPVLEPLAALIEGPDGGSLVPLAEALAGAAAAPARGRSAGRGRGGSGSGSEAGSDRIRAGGGAAAALRALGVSDAAVALGEVREALADALVEGLASLTARRVEPLVARLRDLQLARPADLLASLPARPDPADRLDDLVKVHQVLGVALVRLAGVLALDRARLVPVYGYPSVLVDREGVHGAAGGGTAAEAAGGDAAAIRVPSRFEAAAALGGAGSADGGGGGVDMDPDLDVDVHALLHGLDPLWTDGSRAGAIAAALRDQGEAAVRACERVLGIVRTAAGLDLRRHGHASRLGGNVVAAIAAVDVLGQQVRADRESAAGAAADRALSFLSRRHSSPGVRARARRALGEADPATADGSEAPNASAVLASPKEPAAAREEAAMVLGQQGIPAGITPLRRGLVRDPKPSVRSACALALAALGDVGALPLLLHALAARAADAPTARAAALALGLLGDSRAAGAVIGAWVEGFAPKQVRDALGSMGVAAFAPLVERVEGDLALAKRAVKEVLAFQLAEERSCVRPQPAAEPLLAPALAAIVLARADAAAEAPDVVARAQALFVLAEAARPGEDEGADEDGGAPHLRSPPAALPQQLATRLLALRPDLGGRGSPKDEKALRKRIDRELGAPQGTAPLATRKSGSGGKGPTRGSEPAAGP